MKRDYLIAFVFLVLCIYVTISSFMLKTTGMHPASTGAPGERTCAMSTCHSDASVTNDNTNIVNTLVYSAADSSYFPGQIYTITLKAQKSGISKFGFGIVALQNSNTSDIGTWIVTDGARTHFLYDGDTLGNVRTYMTHSSNGTPAVSAGLGQWSFDWKAPATNVGNITFYYASLCTNNNGFETGDDLYLSSFQIHPVAGASIGELMKDDYFKAIYNSFKNELVLNYELLKECELSVSLMDIQGKMIKYVDPYHRSRGVHSDHIDLSKGIRPGIYFVHVTINDQTLAKKIIIP